MLLFSFFPDFGLGKPYGPGLYTPLSICDATESTRCWSDSRPVMMASAIRRAVIEAPNTQPAQKQALHRRNQKK
jgi:hypothetical protein